MKARITALSLIMLISLWSFAQTGHIMQGVGAVNMSMGGAGTAQPTDINGPLLWNPAAISSFNKTVLSVNAGAFFSSPELSSSLPADILFQGSPALSGTTQDARGTSIMPAISMVFGKENSKHTFGFSAFGVSGFGVTFPEEANNPLSPDFDPSQPSNPINYPQQAGGFGRLESDYMLMQISVAYAYAISEKISIGIQPNFNYSALKLYPNPTSSPNPEKGYPLADRTSALGYGAQFGLFFDSKTGFKLGLSYKTPQYFDSFEFSNEYLDGTEGPSNSFTMNFPGILSLGTGYSTDKVDLALDVRQVFYENTEGFSEKGWTETGSVSGFGWKDMTVVSFGVQYKGFDKLPVRLGYTYSTNPIDPQLAFFSTPATAIIKNAFQVGLGYEFSDQFTLNGVYHYGTSSGSTEGKLMNPQLVQAFPPYGEIPGSTVSYTMTTSMVMFGINYTISK
jgi:long-chain fatty acid transport protein